MTRNRSRRSSSDGARAGNAPALDVFALRDSVDDEYKRFTTIHARDIREQVEAIYTRQRYWPEPLIQINPGRNGDRRSLDHRRARLRDLHPARRHALPPVRRLGAALVFVFSLAGNRFDEIACLPLRSVARRKEIQSCPKNAPRPT